MTLKHLIAIAFLSVSPLFAQAQDVNDNDNTTETGNKTDSVVVSSIVIPNAFSPNNDQINDKLMVKAKETVGIVEFRAIIYNRWGQKLYEWTDINDGWDGTYNGRPVKQGTYFVLVKAKGSDGQTHTIRRDVNLLRGYLNDGEQ